MRLQTYRLQIVWSLFLLSNHREPNISIKWQGVCEMHLCVGSVLRDMRGDSSALNLDKRFRPMLPSLNLSGGQPLPGCSSPITRDLMSPYF